MSKEVESQGGGYWDWLERQLESAEPLEANQDSIESIPHDVRKAVLTEVLTRLENYQASQVFTVNEWYVFKGLLQGVSVRRLVGDLGVTKRRIEALMKQVGMKIKKLYDEELENHIGGC